MPVRKSPTKRATRVDSGESRHPRMLPRTKAEAAATARLRRICMALPEVVEKIAWGEPTWRAGNPRAAGLRVGKLFAQLDTHHHGADHVAVWLVARPGVQEDLVAEDPVHFFRPPYVGHKGWLGVRIDNRPDWKTVASLVADAYREVAPPPLRAKLERERDAPRSGWRASWVDAGEDPQDRRRSSASRSRERFAQ